MPLVVNRVTKIYRTKLFTEVWKDYDAYKTDYDSFAALVNGGTAPFTDANTIKAIYYLLYARYGNSPIICTDETVWKFKVFTIISAYGPAWAKKKAIQTTIRAFSEDELLTGGKQVYNHAFNPSTEPSTSDIEELDHINEQNVTNNRRSKIEAYALYWANIHNDPTEEFVGKFNKTCFSKFVGDQAPIIYVTEEEQEDEEENP